MSPYCHAQLAAKDYGSCLRRRRFFTATLSFAGGVSRHFSPALASLSTVRAPIDWFVRSMTSPVAAGHRLILRFSKRVSVPPDAHLQTSRQSTQLPPLQLYYRQRVTAKCSFNSYVGVYRRTRVPTYLLYPARLGNQLPRV